MNELIIKDKFVDYAGQEHVFILAAIKEPIRDSYKTPQVIRFTVPDDIYQTIIGPCNNSCSIGNVRAGLKIGISICNPVDEFDENLGITKAVGRARKAKASIFAEFSGQLGENLIRCYLAQEAKYIKDHPEKVIKGYKEAEKKYLLNKEMTKVADNFTEIEKCIVEETKKNPTFLDNIHKYLSYIMPK